MSHILVTCVGTPEDLEWIYENCTSDSSSESREEQAFGYDYMWYYDYNSEKILRDNLSIDNYSSIVHHTGDSFYKEHILSGEFDAENVLDLRQREDWYCPIFNTKTKKNRTKEELIKWFKKLPEETPFFFCDAHV